MIYHKHLLVNAKVKNPMQSEQEGIDFLNNLVKQIDMKVIKGPFASYVDKDGNKGLTAIVMIETSHIAFHIWDEVDPGLVQFDLYTCSDLPVEKVIANLENNLGLKDYKYMVVEREEGFNIVRSHI